MTYFFIILDIIGDFINIKINFITGNLNKVKEGNIIVNELCNNRISLNHLKIDYPEIQGTLEEVSEYGAKYVYNIIKKPLIVEDSGLFIKSLNNFPGTYSKFVQNTIGNNGILKLLNDNNNREAYFKTVIGYCDENGVKLFSGVVNGNISNKILEGNYGFAYDSIFIPKGYKKSFSQISTNEKSKISHRRKAFEELCKFLNNNLNIINYY